MSGISWREARGKWSVWRFHWLIHHRVIRALERARPYLRGALLDVGCGTKPFARVFEAGLASYWGVDLPDWRFFGPGGGQGPSRGPEVYARGEALPFRDASLDTVLGLSMISYVPEPLLFLREAKRVLRPGGHLVIEFTQMASVFDAADYWRFTPRGAAELLGRAGLEPLEFIPLGGFWRRVGVVLTDGLQRINRGPVRILTELPVRVLYVSIHVCFEALDRVFYDPKDTIAHLVVARRNQGSP